VALQIQPFFDPRTWTLTYVVWDEQTRDAVVIDPVLDYDPLAVRVFEESLDQVLGFVRSRELKVHYVLDTHAHADHLSGFQKLRAELGAKIGIGRQITAVQQVFRGLFGWGEDFRADGSQWDVLVGDGDVLRAGALSLRAIHTPGHTPACLSYVVGDAVFTGDVLFLPDSGTGRCDFPGGSASDLYDSIQKLYALPDATRVFVGHDYQPDGREVRWETTIGESKRSNLHLRADTSREAFVAFREARDKTLRPPTLIFQSLQVNARAGALPDPEPNGRVYLKLPMNVFSRKP
jgi:glyoxylase-like metal-dependent hydrolase (beta-lactamase superfamily II)